MATSGASFGNLPGNNAPSPVFGGTNPTGMLPGGFDTKSSYGFPNYNMFGGNSTPGSSFVTPIANQGIFGTGGTGTGIQGLSSSFSGGGFTSGGNSNIVAQLDEAYGTGVLGRCWGIY